MPHAKSPALALIKLGLHAQFEETLRQPLPERWVDLIHFLNDREKLRREGRDTTQLVATGGMDNPERWRKRAEECRTLARKVSDPGAQRMMLDLAASYDLLAERATPEPPKPH